MSDPAPAISLTRVAAALRGRVALLDEDAEWLAAAIGEFLEKGGDLQRHLGLRPKPGERSCSTQLASEREADLYRLAAARFFPDQSRLLQSTRLHSELLRYFNSTWCFDAASEDYRPPAGTLREACWLILKNRPRVLGARTIRLALSSPYSLPAISRPIDPKLKTQGESSHDD